tara:strand:- start:1944 stop:2384 length:441 start_codon:yes stop_codon:yes gene_type:complete
MELVSKVREVDAHLFKMDNHALLENKYLVEKIDVSSIALVVRNRREQKSFHGIWKSIQQDGMKTPIIVLPNTEINYDMAKRQITLDLVVKRNPNLPYLAYTGHQRLEIASSMKFTEISAIVCSDVHWAHAAHLTLDGKVDNRDRRI